MNWWSSTLKVGLKQWQYSSLFQLGPYLSVLLVLLVCSSPSVKGHHLQYPRHHHQSHRSLSGFDVSAEHASSESFSCKN